MPKFTITEPKARLGQTVDVLNYRRRPAIWMMGVVTCVEAREIWRPGFDWCYTVDVHGVNYRITVGDVGIILKERR